MPRSATAIFFSEAHVVWANFRPRPHKESLFRSDLGSERPFLGSFSRRPDISREIGSTESGPGSSIFCVISEGGLGSTKSGRCLSKLRRRDQGRGGCCPNLGWLAQGRGGLAQCLGDVGRLRGQLRTPRGGQVVRGLHRCPSDAELCEASSGQSFGEPACTSEEGRSLNKNGPRSQGWGRQETAGIGVREIRIETNIAAAGATRHGGAS